MTRQEMFNLIVEKCWGGEIKKKFGLPYISCSNEKLAAFIAEKQGSKKSTEKQENKEKKEVNTSKPKKTQEQLLAEISARVDAYKESTRDIREKSEKLDEYTKLLSQVKEADAFILTKDGSCDVNEKGVIYDSCIKMKFDDNEFVRELLVCFITERINSMLDSIDKTKKQLKAI